MFRHISTGGNGEQGVPEDVRVERHHFGEGVSKLQFDLCVETIFEIIDLN